MSVVVKMMNRMIHRGPDSFGYHHEGALHFGVRRLRILDLKTGDQPVLNESKNVGIIFNGEIYNYKELRHRLENLGHCFGTQSDTETILHSYEQWGEDCCKYLRGMYAFAIWDVRDIQRFKVFLARDRLGIKPLYYSIKANRMVFASEVRALLASDCVLPKVSWVGLYSYLFQGSLQEPLTIVQDVYSLPPSSWKTIEIENETLVFRDGNYWTPPQAQSSDCNSPDVMGSLHESVTLHMASDVPLGIFLSGGLDSGSIVALGSLQSAAKVNTFTLSFDEEEFNESDRARKTARFWSSNHVDKRLGLEEFLGELPAAVSSMDQPSSDGVNTWFISKVAKESGLTVILSGLGGDELFGGYPSFNDIPTLENLEFFRGNKIWGKKAVSPFIKLIPISPDRKRKVLSYMRREGLFLHPYFFQRGLFTHAEITNMIRTDLVNSSYFQGNDLEIWHQNVDQNMDYTEFYDVTSRISWLEMSQYMRNSLLRDSDSMGMAHSLEIRVPFLDHVLVEKILASRMQRNGSKLILRKAMKGLLPVSVLQGDKHTFSLPIEIWMRDKNSGEFEKSILSKTNPLTEFLVPETISGIYCQFQSGQMSWARPWTLYCLQKWIENNF